MHNTYFLKRRSLQFFNVRFYYTLLYYVLPIFSFQILFLLVFVSISPIPSVLPEAFNQYPQGYYPFEESPAKIPPKVRKPPYLQTQVNCPGMQFSM